MLFNLLQCKREEILLVKFIEDDSFDHLGLKILDISSLKNEIFSIPEDPFDESSILNYLRTQDEDITKKIGDHLVSEKDKALWAKRKRFYIFFIATETDLPNHFLEFYMKGDEEDDDESLLSRTTSIKENKIEGGISGMSSYLKQISLTDLEKIDPNLPYFEKQISLQTNPTIEVADFPSPVKQISPEKQNSEAPVITITPGSPEKSFNFEGLNTEPEQKIKPVKKSRSRKGSSKKAKDLEAFGFSTTLKINTTAGNASPKLAGRKNLPFTEEAYNKEYGSDDEEDERKDTVVVEENLLTALSGKEIGRAFGAKKSKSMLVEEKTVDEKPLTKFMNKIKGWKSVSMSKIHKSTTGLNSPSNSMSKGMTHVIGEKVKETKSRDGDDKPSGFGGYTKLQKSISFENSPVGMKIGSPRSDHEEGHDLELVQNTGLDTADTANKNDLTDQAEINTEYIDDFESDDENTGGFRSPEHLMEEATNFLTSMKVLGVLMGEKCRESYILKDGLNLFFDKYPYAKKDHPSQLYKLMMKPEGIPNEILPNHIWLGNAHHVRILSKEYCLTPPRLQIKTFSMLWGSHMYSISLLKSIIALKKMVIFLPAEYTYFTP